MSTWTANVPLFTDGVSILNQATVNPVVTALANRDQYLFEMLNNKSDKTVLISYNQPIYGNLAPGTPVYFNNSSGQAVLYPAQAGYSPDSTGHLIPATSAFIFGIVDDIYEGQTGPVVYGDIYVRGLISGIDFSQVLDTASLAEGTLQPGPLYLSSNEPGKLTIYPSGAGIFVGYYIGSESLVLAPNIDSLNQLYFNYRIEVPPLVAGTPSLPSADNGSLFVWHNTTTGLNYTISSVNNPPQLAWVVTATAINANNNGAGLIWTDPTNGLNYTISCVNNPPQLAWVLTGSPNTNNGAVMVWNNTTTNLNYTIEAIGAPPQLAWLTTSVNTNVWTIIHNPNATTDMTNKVGWVNASDAQSVLLITPPTNAQFYYNLPTAAVIIATTEDNTQPYYLTALQKDNALELLNALPAYPVAYTMVFMNGILQTLNDTDHPNGAYIIDENGLWWTQNQINYVPWSGSPGPVDLQLLITKLNPNFSDSVVTSLTPTNSALTITNPAGQPATVGNLNIQLQLPITNIGSTGNGTALQSIAYNTSTGLTTTQTAPVINSVVVGPGLVVTQNIPGQLVLSLSNFSLTGEVADIEPEEADFIYKGLNAYLRLKNPIVNQKLGFVGKFMVPATIPSNTPISIQLVCFTDNNTVGSGTAAFTFEYVVSYNTSSISSATVLSNVSIPGSLFPSLTQTTIYTDSNNNPYFTIPASAFSGGSYVNFRIARVNSNYSNSIGILGVLWIIA
jgi:hypothetical protein